MRALLAQLGSVDGAIEPNLARLEAVLARHPDVQLAIFPELFLSGYELNRAKELAISAQSAEMDRLRGAAAQWRTAVICGFPERTAEGAAANAAVCIDAGGALVGIYRKTHLFGQRERDAFVDGRELLLVGLADRRIAPLICFDVEFPEPARALARAGADLIVTIAANMRPHGEEHALAARARALDNRCAHLYVNRVGTYDGLEFVGGSLAIDSSGRSTASADSGTGVGGGADREEPVVEDALARKDEPVGAADSAAVGRPAATAGAERLLEVEVPPLWAGVGSDGDYLEHVRWGLPVRAAGTHSQPPARSKAVAMKAAWQTEDGGAR